MAACGMRQVGAARTIACAFAALLCALALALAPSGASTALADDWDDQVIRGAVEGDPYDSGARGAEAPSFDVMHLDNLLPAFTHWVYTSLVAPAIIGLASLAAWVAKLADPTALLAGNLTDGPFSGARPVVEAVNDVAVVYARVLVGVVFLSTIFDPVRGRGAEARPERLDGFIRRLVLLFAAIWATGAALDVLTVAANLCGQVFARVSSAIGAGGPDVGQQLLESSCSLAQGLTYKDFGQGVLFVLALAGCLMVIGRAAVRIVAGAMTRGAELYLRASLAAVPMAFIASDRQRQISVNYLKRFCAVALEAAVILAAFAAVAPLQAAGSTIIGGLIDSAGGLASDMAGVSAVAGLARAALPAIAAMSCAAAVVDRSGSIANSLLGV